MISKIPKRFLIQNPGETKIKLLQQIHLFTETFRAQLHPFSSRSIFSVNPLKSTSLSMQKHRDEN